MAEKQKKLPAVTSVETADIRRADADARRAYFDTAKNWTEYLAVEMPRGGTFMVSTSDRSVARTLFARRIAPEMGTLRRAVRVLKSHRGGRLHKPGSTILDIGAHIGTATITAITEHAFRHAVAVEPEPGNLRLLRANLALNGLEGKVVVVEAALTDTDGGVALRLNRNATGSHRVIPRSKASALVSKGRAVNIDGRSVDSLVEEGAIDPETLGLVWMDVRGHEDRILRGGRKLLERAPPLILQLSTADIAAGDDRGAFENLLATAYGHVVDLRSASKEVTPEPASAIGGIIDRYALARDAKVTDLLFLPR